MALLREGPRYGYQLKTEFEAATGGAWTINVGQIYTTLDRLGRDGLVVIDESDEQKLYSITLAGVDELGAWWDAVPAEDPPPRDELMLKMLMAIDLGPDHALAVITKHRTALTTLLQRRRRAIPRTASPGDGPGGDEGLAAALVADALIVRARSRPPLARPLRGPSHLRPPPPDRDGKHPLGHERPESSDVTMTATDTFLPPTQPSGDAPMLEFRDVVKSYGSGATEVRAVTDVTLSFPAGQFCAVMGPSGCGKSTLLHLAGALESPNAGRVLVDGADVSTMNAVEQAELRRRHVGYVFQQLNLIPALTAIENVMLPLELDGVPTKQARARAAEMLRRVDLKDHNDRYPDDFSGGQRQRIAIARAVAGERKLLLADEPTGALDTISSDEIVSLLAGLSRDNGTTVVMVTHEPRLASWADRTVFMRDGRLVDDSGDITAADSTPVPASTTELGDVQ